MAARNYPVTLGANAMADLIGVTPRTLQLWAKDDSSIRDNKRGYIVKKVIAHALGNTGDSEESKRKAESEQKRRDLDNDLREENLRKTRDEVMDRSIVEISKQQYVAGIVKRHVAWRPRMKREFPDIETEILDYCDKELEAIRESCRTFMIDESEDTTEE
jgi:DNA-binding transcriptional MerR regulator